MHYSNDRQEYNSDDDVYDYDHRERRRSCCHSMLARIEAWIMTLCMCVSRRYRDSYRGGRRRVTLSMDY